MSQFPLSFLFSKTRDQATCAVLHLALPVGQNARTGFQLPAAGLNEALDGIGLVFITLSWSATCFRIIPTAEIGFVFLALWFGMQRHYIAGTRMNLMLWLVTMFLLGLATMGLMFAFLAGCEKV